MSAFYNIEVSRMLSASGVKLNVAIGGLVKHNETLNKLIQPEINEFSSNNIANILGCSGQSIDKSIVAFAKHSQGLNKFIKTSEFSADTIAVILKNTGGTK